MHSQPMAVFSHNTLHQCLQRGFSSQAVEHCQIKLLHRWFRVFSIKCNRLKKFISTSVDPDAKPKSVCCQSESEGIVWHVLWSMLLMCSYGFVLFVNEFKRKFDNKVVSYRTVSYHIVFLPSLVLSFQGLQNPIWTKVIATQSKGLK